MEKTALDGAVELILLRKPRRLLRFFALILLSVCACLGAWLFYAGGFTIPSSISTIWEMSLPGAATPTPGPRVKGAVILPQVSAYAVQFGAYASEPDALAEASKYTARGAAGYVVRDDTNRVLGAVYLTLDEANNVINMLKTDEGITAAVYEIKGEQVDMQITATKAQIDAIASAIFAYGEGVSRMCALSQDLDRRTLDALSVKRQLTELSTALRTVRTELESQIAGQTNAIATGLLTLLRDFESTADNLSRFEGQSGMALSSQIKYNTIDRLIKRVEYVRTITTEKV